jgi:hypothetical protein
MPGENDTKSVYIQRTQPNTGTEGDDFLPETDFGRELWALRRKAIAEGMALLSGDEISEEIAAGRNR